MKILITVLKQKRKLKILFCKRKSNFVRNALEICLFVELYNGLEKIQKKNKKSKSHPI